MASVPRKLSRTETNINNFDFGFTRSRGNQDRKIVGDVDVVDVVDAVDVVEVVDVVVAVSGVVDDVDVVVVDVAFAVAV